MRYVQNILNDQDLQVWKAFVDLAGRSALRLGLSRSLGQVYAAIFLSPRPMGLEDLMEALHISKGNTSMSVRQLAEWGTIRAVWIKGDRRDYYEATEAFGPVARHFLSIVLKPRIASTEAQLRTMEVQIESQSGKISEEGRFMKERIARLKNFHRKISKLVPLVEKFL
jgi:DNA-binding transcriptional regulator GbsR (MarR family)